MRLSKGPRESHARPSVDVLFRSAAYYARPRVIGIVLTGMLDDGTAGLWAIKDRGGIAIVQSPAEAPYPSMPRSALRHVAVDYELKIDEMPGLLSALTQESLPAQDVSMSHEKLQTEVAISLEDDTVNRGVLSLGTPSPYTCPECHGSMVRIHEGSIERFRCHTGHGYSARALADKAPGEVEKTMWAALAQLEEYQMILGELARPADQSEPEKSETDKKIADLKVLMRRLRALATDPALSTSSASE